MLPFNLKVSSLLKAVAEVTRRLNTAVFFAESALIHCFGDPKGDTYIF